MHEEKGRNASDEIISKRIREEIIPILYQVVRNDEERFHNPHAAVCWQKNGCTNTDCPAYAKPEIPCWYRSGTFCAGEVQGTFVEKRGGCTHCEVFKEICPTLVEEIGEALNHLLFSLREEKSTVRKQLKKIEYLNKELVSALENLDARNREIQELVITDKLTGLYNRNYLLTSLADEIERFGRGNAPLTVMMVDFDDFKAVNDTYGHLNGDRVLSSFGLLLQKIIRKYDRPYRYGGEEFFLVLPDTELTVAWILAERIKRTFQEQRFEMEGSDGVRETVSLTLSIGLAPCVRGMTAGALLEQADEAMYKAKTEGKNKVVRYGLD